MTDLLNAKALSPVTTLAAAFDSRVDNEIELDDTVTDYFITPESGINGVAMLCAIGDMRGADESAFETIEFTGVDEVNNKLTGVTNIEGDQREWPAGTYIASMMSAEHIQRINTMILGLDDSVTTAAGEISDHKGKTTEDDDVHDSKTYADTKLSKSGGTMTGEIDCNDNLITQPDIKDYVETLASLTWDSATEDVDLEDANVFDVSVEAAVTTLTFSNPRAGAHSFTLILTQDATGREITWPASVKWPGGTAPTIDGASEVHILTFFTPDSGTTWYGFHAGSDMS
jgi:hypothetical protein